MSTLMMAQRSLALLTDLYQLTMAQGYWQSGVHEREAVFNLFFRQHPFKAGYTVACGLHQVGSFLERFRFEAEDCDYLAGLTGADGHPLFKNAFLDYLKAMVLDCEVFAVPEGTVVFPNEPLIRVRGPLIQCQLLETALLNMVNFQTLVATKAARMVTAAQGDPILEFGLRRAQGIDGSLSATYAAMVAGCQATSNVLAGSLFNVPVKGTHAHSWVMAFDTEEQAFERYADAMPNNCVFLVDTYDTLEGVHKAVTVGRRLREKGHRMLGIRLDSGDLCRLSIEARAILDEAGFADARIVASNDLDEYEIERLKAAGCRIDTWGVGTRLVTAYDQPALGGVYKLAAMTDDTGHLQPRLKLSEEVVKTSNPGVQQVRRLWRGNHMVGDVIYRENEHGGGAFYLGDSEQPLPQHDREEDLLQPLFVAGALLMQNPLGDARVHAAAQLAALPEACRKLRQPGAYPVGLEPGLYYLKQKLSAMKGRGA